jgi:iron complex transport system substrate-binding protein
MTSYPASMRVVSLLPSATEIVAALGLTGSLVGRSQECDWPPEVRELPVVTAARIDSDALSGAEIDAAVRAAVADGRSLYALDADLVERLAPDVIVTQDLCAVCAVSSGEVCDVGARVVSLDPRTIAEIGDSVVTLGRELGRVERGREVAAELHERIERVRAAVAGLPRRRIFVAEWLDPPFASGHWIPEMVAAAGGADVLGRAGAHSVPTTWEAVAAERPELIVLAPCGFDARRALQEAAGLELPAPSVAVDANAYFARPSPRIADGVEQLGRLLHPEAFATAA